MHAFAYTKEKTRVWNAAGEEPSDLARLQPIGADLVWTGALYLPGDQQGLLVLGAPLGSAAFVRRELGRKRAVQEQLFSRLHAVGDLQSARRKVSHTSMTTPSVRVLRPCFFKAPNIRCPSPRSASRLGLRSAIDAAPSAYWASWADCLPTIRARAPLAADRLVQAPQSATETAAPLAAARHAAACLREQGYNASPWASLQQGQPPPGQKDREFGDLNSAGLAASGYPCQ